MKRFFYGLVIVAFATAGCVSDDSDDAVVVPDIAVDSRPVGQTGERLNRINGIQRITIPDGMLAEDVIGTIVETVRYCRGYYRVLRDWQILKVDETNNFVLLQMAHGKHGMNVCLRIEGNQIIADVPYSNNLRQNKTRIHRAAIKWANAFISIVQRNVEIDCAELMELKKD